MARAAWRGGVVVAAGVCGVACRMLVDTSGLDDGPAGSTDASTTSDGSVVVDGGRTDSGSDGGDGSSPTVDAAPSPCKTRDAAFCDDFDDGLLGAKWTSIELTGGATLAFDTNALSPPRSVKATTPGNLGNTQSAYLRLAGDTVSNASCEFDMQIVQAPTGANRRMEVLFVDLARPNGVSCLHWFEVGAQATFLNGGGVLPDGGQDYSSDQLPAMPTGSWVHVSFSTDCSTVQVKMNGTQVLSRQAIVVEPRSSSTVGVGLTYTDMGTPGAVLVDNFLCDATP